MDYVSIIIMAIGAVITVVGYIIGKKSSSKKAKIPANYTEFVGICKKHREKNDKFFEVYEIICDGKTLKYEASPKDSKDQLKGIDSIEKFYIDNEDSSKIKTAADFSGDNKEDKEKMKPAYITMGIGLALLIVSLIMALF